MEPQSRAHDLWLGWADGMATLPPPLDGSAAPPPHLTSPLLPRGFENILPTVPCSYAEMVSITPLPSEHNADFWLFKPVFHLKIEDTLPVIPKAYRSGTV